MIEELSKSGVEIAVFFPVYSLAPYSRYPTQFQQAVEAVKYVTHDLGRDPKDIILSGDSAGANLCLAIISHLLHPSKDVPKLDIGKPFGGMILFSPWISFDTNTWPSMKYNYWRDVESHEVLNAMADNYVGGQKSDFYIEAADAPADWWANAPVDRTLVVAGGDEILLDSMIAWADKFKVIIVGKLWESELTSDRLQIATCLST